MLSIPTQGLKVNLVKLLRLGNVGKEIPAAVDKNGKFRDKRGALGTFDSEK